VPVDQLPTLEQRMDDVRAVMDAAGSERAALMGTSEGGPMNLLFAATHPKRTAALVLVASYARLSVASDYPAGTPTEVSDNLLDRIDREWGTGVTLGAVAASHKDDPQMREWWARYQRQAASPGAAVALLRMPGQDHLFFVGDADALLAEIQEFLTGTREPGEPERILATVLFADIVASTERAAQLGDHRWHELLENYYELARRELTRFRGREIDTAGDGFFAAFDGPARAVRCAEAITMRVRALGIEVRAGLHTGECEIIGEKVGGIAVHIGARVAALARPGEVLVSNTVKDLVAGSGLVFEERGTHALKGVPGEWRLYAATPAA
jgi:class 3 adenylate cyclase